MLFGALLGGQEIPAMPSSSTLSAFQDLRSDKSLSTLFSILQADNLKTGQGPRTSILVASFPTQPNASQGIFLYVLPTRENATVILIDNRTAMYYFVVLAFDGSIARAASGPNAIPSQTGIGGLPQVDIQPLYNDETAVKLARAAVGMFGLGLSIALGPENRLVDVIFPEIVGLEIGWVGILGAAVTSVEDRISGARRRILMTPISRFSFVLGSALANILLISLQVLVLFATAIFVFSVNISGSLYDLIPVIIAASFSVVGIGLAISHFSKTPDEAFYFSALVNLPSGFLASQYIPVVRTQLSILVSSLFPMTYANKALTAIMLNGATFTMVLPELLTLALFAIVLYFAGTILIMRER